MVCKRSLYCWKNGPCASDQTRKQIWEDNIRFRESLRSNFNSDHYWSFQVSNNNHCSCIEGARKPPLHKRFLSGSLQKLDCADCTSITHDLKSRGRRKSNSDDISCPLHLGSKLPGNQSAIQTESNYTTPAINGERKSILKASSSDVCSIKNSFAACDLNNNISRSVPSINRSSKSKLNEDLPKFCPRYKNTLTNAPLPPCVKFQYSSQPSLLNDKRSNDLKKKCNIKNFASIEDLKSKNNVEIVQNVPKNDVKDEGELKTREILEKKKLIRFPKRNVYTSLSRVNRKPLEVRPREEDVEGDIDDSQPLEGRKLRLPQRNVFTPLSRTTRRLFHQDKRLPFVTFGCNNVNSDVGSKRTHNVLAAEHEVFQSALSAKQKRQDMILRFLNTEKDLQRKLLPDNFQKKLVNHSGVWANEYPDPAANKEKNKTPPKIPPMGDKRPKACSIFQREQKPLNAKPKIFRRTNSQSYFY